ncbi:MAG: hypothetical protein GQ475_01680 [Methylococcaceae bacterium]|nr:hypothetical protein [Methylococcaceae bacterium]
MTTEINQKISQFLDDELDHGSLDDFLLKINQQPELKGKIRRYQIMTQAMTVDSAVIANADFLDNIKHQLKQDPHYLLPQQAVKKSQSRFWQKTSWAVAATVACVAVILSQQGGLQHTTQPQQLAEVEPKTIETPVQVASSQLTQHERLKAYLQAHNDDLYTHGSLNMQPLARMASYGQE